MRIFKPASPERHLELVHSQAKAESDGSDSLREHLELIHSPESQPNRLHRLFQRLGNFILDSLEEGGRYTYPVIDSEETKKIS